MRLLLDTHAFIWWVTGDQRLAPSTVALLSNPANDLLLSSISVYEMAIKVRLGKLDLKGMSLKHFVDEGFRRGGLAELPVRIEHAIAAQSLPLHHKDPFDRLLIATAIADGLQFVSDDAEVRKYSVNIVW